MIKFYLTFLLNILSTELKAQWRNCDLLCCYNDLNPNFINECKTTQDYIARNWPKYKKHINNRKKLNILNPTIRTEYEMIFSDFKRIEIKLNFKKISIQEFLALNNELSLELINEKYVNYFGLNSLDTSFQIIDSIVLNGKYIPGIYYQDLLNVNTTINYISVRPIECYKSLDNRFIYIYLFGKPILDHPNINNPLLYSYMTKLIFKSNGDFIGRILEGAEFLNYYGFSDCPEFVGF
jgi:hypothetical protein